MGVGGTGGVDSEFNLVIGCGQVGSSGAGTQDSSCTMATNARFAISFTRGRQNNRRFRSHWYRTKFKKWIEIVAKVLLEAYSKPDCNFESVFANNLKLYGDVDVKIDQHVAQQSQLAKSIQACFNYEIAYLFQGANARFQQSKQNNEGLKQRETALNNLEQAYQSFKVLTGNLQEGIKVHNRIIWIILIC
jgi:hypothetical protein